MAFCEALRRHLPDAWTALHSLRLRTGEAWEDEGDFIAAAPGCGLLAVAVKAGRIDLVGGRWLKKGHEMGRAPRQRALGFARRLVEAVRVRGEEAALPADPRLETLHGRQVS